MRRLSASRYGKLRRRFLTKRQPKIRAVPPTRRSRASNVIVRYRSPKGVAVGAPTGITMQGFAMSDVVVVIGSGSIGQANARRASAGKHVVLADLRSENAGRAAEIMLDAGFDVSTAVVDVQ